MPILSFPGVQIINRTVDELVRDGNLQADCMEAIAKRYPMMGAAVRLMDLSVEAEAFGAKVLYSKDEVPTMHLRGMEELFCDMMEENEMAEARARYYVEAGVDVIFFGDDIGMQHTIMMSEELYCRWIKPRLKKLIDFVKSLNPDILVFYHSCGFIEPFIPHLIEAGVDVLNPIQSECMDFKEICKKYGDKISFHGTIGTQTVMPHGTPEEVKQAVWDNLDAAGEKGGLMVAPTHMLELEVPLENIIAYAEACRTYKK